MCGSFKLKIEQSCIFAFRIYEQKISCRNLPEVSNFYIAIYNSSYFAHEMQKRDVRYENTSAMKICHDKRYFLLVTKLFISCIWSISVENLAEASFLDFIRKNVFSVAEMYVKFLIFYFEAHNFPNFVIYGRFVNILYLLKKTFISRLWTVWAENLAGASFWISAAEISGKFPICCCI